MRNRDRRTAISSAWMSQARCARPDVSHISFYEDRRPEGAEPAKAICSRCVVREECLDYALTGNERYGIWGGMTPGERSDIIQN
jgi:WhiB family redox-sensing transcriptional regulator